MLDYSRFTKRQSKTKSFQLELKPLPATQEYLDSTDFMARDNELAEIRDKLSPVIDRFGLDFIEKALKHFEYDFHVFDDYNDFKSVKKEDIDAVASAVQKCYAGTIKAEGYDKIMSKFGVDKESLQSKDFFLTFLPEWIASTEDDSFDHDEALAACEGTRGCVRSMVGMATNKATIFMTLVPKRIVENYFIFRDNIYAISELLNDGILTGETAEKAARMADPDGYVEYLTQSEIDAYNLLISGVSTEKGMAEKGINNIVNEYNQAHSADKSYTGRFYHKVKKLYKQFFTEQEAAYNVQRVENDHEAKELVKSTFEKVSATASNIRSLFRTVDKESLSVSGKNLHTISHMVYGSHDKIPDKMQEHEQKIASQLLSDGTKRTKKEAAKIEKIISNPSEAVRSKFYSMPFIESVMDGNDVFAKLRSEVIASAAAVTSAASALAGSSIYKEDTKLKTNREYKDMLLNAFTAVTDFRSLLSALRVPEEEQKDAVFYNAFSDYYDELQDSANAKRPLNDYFTRKPGDEAEKVLTCFNTPAKFETMIMSDGHESFTKEYMTIMRDGGKYYYLTLEGSAKPMKFKDGGDDAVELFYEKKGQKPEMSIPKYVFTTKYDGTGIGQRFDEDSSLMEYTMTERVNAPVTVTRRDYEIKSKGLFSADAVKKGIVTEEEKKKNLTQLIGLYIRFIKSYKEYALFDFSKLKNPEEYGSMPEFMNDVKKYVFSLGFFKADRKQVMDAIKSHQLLAFEITCMQLRTGNLKGNSYAAVLAELMSDENTKTHDYILNSHPSVFYRKAVLPKHVTHRKGSFIVNKRYADGTPIPPALYEAVYRIKNDMPTDMAKEALIALHVEGDKKIVCKKCAYDISKYRRFMEGKFILQASYQKNVEAGEGSRMPKLNGEINELLKDGCNTLTVIRGTQTLVYFRVCDKDGKELYSENLNVIDGINHWEKLRQMSESRKDAQREWEDAETVKEYKDAYIAKAISRIVRAAVKYNAVILVEKIDDARKDKYSALDNTVFKRFETMLVERCSDLFFNDIPDGEIGSQTNAYHLADPDIKSQYQNGIIYFVTTPYITALDPESGFVPMFDTGRVTSTQVKRQFLGKFRNISIKGGKIAYDFDYDDFKTKYILDKTEWTVSGSGVMTTYDRTHQCYNKYSDMVHDYIVPKLEENGVSADGNLSVKAVDGTLTSTAVDVLFNTFRMLSGGIRKCAGPDNRDVYISPITGKTYDREYTSAFNLERKWRFSRSFTGESTDFLPEFFNSVQ